MKMRMVRETIRSAEKRATGIKVHGCHKNGGHDNMFACRRASKPARPAKRAALAAEPKATSDRSQEWSTITSRAESPKPTHQSAAHPATVSAGLRKTSKRGKRRLRLVQPASVTSTGATGATAAIPKADFAAVADELERLEQRAAARAGLSRRCQEALAAADSQRTPSSAATLTPTAIPEPRRLAVPWASAFRPYAAR